MYLEALEAHKPKRGRRRTPDGMNARLAKLTDEIPAANPLRRVQLVQERIDLQAELEKAEISDDISALENDFVKVAKTYSDRKGLSYAAWRELGVPAGVLGRAGISRGSR